MELKHHLRNLLEVAVGIIIGLFLAFLIYANRTLASEVQVSNVCFYNNTKIENVSSLKDRVLICRLNVRNTSPFFLRDVKLKVKIPEGTKYFPEKKLSYLKSSGGVLVWTIPHLAPAEQKVLVYKLKVLR